MSDVVCCGTCINFNIKEEDYSFDRECELKNRSVDIFQSGCSEYCQNERAEGYLSRFIGKDIT